MRNKLIFATNNPHKLDEVRAIAGDRIDIVSLAEAGCHDDIPETADTLEGNALLKARYVVEKFGLPCFADDTGLLVDALGGEPGVLSARYAKANGRGDGHDSRANSALLLERLEGVDDRKAHFLTAIALIYPAQGDTPQREYLVEGRVDGVITRSPMGDDGFGYDPVFRPEGSELTFAQMSADRKNAISHRRRATWALIDLLDRLDRDSQGAD